MYLNKIVLVLCACIVNCDENVVVDDLQKEHSFEVSAGWNVDLPCDLGPPDMALREKALVGWYKLHEQNNSTDETVYSYDGRMAASAAQATRWSCSSLSGRARFEPARGALHVRGVRVSDSGRYRCLVNHSGLPELNTYVVLSVIDNPTTLTIMDSHGIANNRRLGPFYEGDTFNITCVVSGGNPQPWVQWWLGSRLVSENWRAVSARRTRNVYRVGPLRRQDAGAELSCRAGLQSGHAVLNASVWIQLKLSPVSVVLYSVETVAAPAMGDSGEDAEGAAGGMEFRCDVEGAFPPPPVRWYRDGASVHYKQNITVLEDESRLFSSVWLEVTARDHGSNVTCCSGHDRHGAAKTGHHRHGDGGGHKRHNQSDMCSSRVISLTFPPLLEILVNDSSSLPSGAGAPSSGFLAREGASVTLTCLPRANPEVQTLEWYFNSSQLLRSCVEPHEPACAALTLAVTRADAGVYHCRAENDAGAAQSEPFLLNVTYPPRCLTEGVVEYGVGPDSDAPLNISCGMDVPPSSQSELYYWFYSNDTDYTIKNDHQPSLRRWLPLPEQTGSVLQIKINDNSTYGYLSCWVEASLEWDSEGAPCVFLLRPWSRPHAPHNCQARIVAPASATLPQLHVSCDEGHSGGLPQEFQLNVVSKESSEVVSSIRSKHPHFTAELEVGAALQQYIVQVSASNQLGDSALVELADLELDVTGSNHSMGGVGGVTLQSMSLWLAGAVCALVLVACGAALLAAHAPPDHSHTRGCSNADPIYECEESERGSQCSLRRTESFRRAVATVPRTHRHDKVYGAGAVGGAGGPLRLDTPMSHAEAQSVYGTMRTCHYNSDFRKPSMSAGLGVCRGHSVRSVCGGRGFGATVDCEGGANAGCSGHNDSLLLHLPNDFPNYSIPKPAVPLVTQTLPRRGHNRSGDFPMTFGPSSVEELPLPPPPITRDAPGDYSNVLISPLNTVGLPATSTTSFYRGTEQPLYEKENNCTSSTVTVAVPHSTLHF